MHSVAEEKQIGYLKERKELLLKGDPLMMQW